MWLGVHRRLTIRTSAQLNHAGHFAHQLRNTSLGPLRCSAALVRAGSSYTRHPYTEAEDRTIRELRDKGQDWEEIAKQIGRSLPSLKSHWYCILDDRASSQPTPRFFTKEEDEAITRLRSEGLSWGEICTALGRSKDAVTSRWYRHISDRDLRMKHPGPPRVYSKHLSDDEVDQIILQRVRENRWFTEIAEELGCSDATVGKRYRRLCRVKGESNAYAERFENRDVKFAQKIVQLKRREGLSDKAIAISLGIDPRTVAHHLRRGSLASDKGSLNSPVDEDERQLILDRHEHGVAVSQIARECNRSLSTVRGLLHRHANPAPKPRRWLQADIEELQRLRTQGVPPNIMAKKLGRSLESIRCRARRLP